MPDGLWKEEAPAPSWDRGPWERQALRIQITRVINWEEKWSSALFLLT